jgi:hypothetical protein
MKVDDAATLDRGGFKLETILGSEGKQRLGEFIFGFGALPNLEVEFAGALGRDRSQAADLIGGGLGLKWVPVRQELGWSLGARYDYGRLRMEPGGTALPVTENEHSLTALGSFRFSPKVAAHLNLGVRQAKFEGESDSAGTWGLGVDWGFYGSFTLTAETYGLEGERPRSALGLRYALREGLKASAAAGRGQGLSFGQFGLAWEF